MLGDEYFEPINWPWVVEQKAGEPGWVPPKHILGWVEMAAEERAGNARHGREQEARWANQEAAVVEADA